MPLERAVPRSSASGEPDGPVAEALSHLGGSHNAQSVMVGSLSCLKLHTFEQRHGWHSGETGHARVSAPRTTWRSSYRALNEVMSHAVAASTLACLLLFMFRCRCKRLGPAQLEKPPELSFPCGNTWHDGTRVTLQTDLTLRIAEIQAIVPARVLIQREATPPSIIPSPTLHHLQTLTESLCACCLTTSKKGNQRSFITRCSQPVWPTAVPPARKAYSVLLASLIADHYSQRRLHHQTRNIIGS
jgi:hypothetical protein